MSYIGYIVCMSYIGYVILTASNLKENKNKNMRQGKNRGSCSTALMEELQAMVEQRLKGEHKWCQFLESDENSERDYFFLFFSQVWNIGMDWRGSSKRFFIGYHMQFTNTGSNNREISYAIH